MLSRRGVRLMPRVSARFSSDYKPVVVSPNQRELLNRLSETLKDEKDRAELSDLLTQLADRKKYEAKYGTGTGSIEMRLDALETFMAKKLQSIEDQVRLNDGVDTDRVLIKNIMRTYDITEEKATEVMKRAEGKADRQMRLLHTPYYAAILLLLAAPAVEVAMVYQPDFLKVVVETFPILEVGTDTWDVVEPFVTSLLIIQLTVDLFLRAWSRIKLPKYFEIVEQRVANRFGAEIKSQLGSKKSLSDRVLSAWSRGNK